MKIVDGKIFVRQSWLNDVLICPERARLAEVNPSFKSGSDATIIGTALHAGIEQVLAGVLTPTVDEMVPYCLNAYSELAKEPHKKSNIDGDKIPSYIESMATAWLTEIMPSVQFGGLIEQGFKVPLNITVNGYEVWLSGTIDYIQPDGTIWDWKTASRTYYAKEKQKQAVQATVYAFAGIHSGWVTDYPVTFRYGIMVRQESPKAQIVTVQRNKSHTDFLCRQTASAIQQGLHLGFNTAWLINDQHNLCSKQWCDFWSICKGANLRDSDLELPSQTVPVVLTTSEPTE